MKWWNKIKQNESECLLVTNYEFQYCFIILYLNNLVDNCNFNITIVLNILNTEDKCKLQLQ